MKDQSQGLGIKLILFLYWVCYECHVKGAISLVLRAGWPNYVHSLAKNISIFFSNLSSIIQPI